MLHNKKSTIVFLGTYPPRECGIATFTQDLLQSSHKFLGPNTLCHVAALNLTPLDTYKYGTEVVWELDQNDSKDYLLFAKTVNDDPTITGVIIQHEYGIFGGKEGNKILHFMKNCKKPMLVTLHTVLPAPSPEMRAVTENIIKLAYSVIVLTTSSKELVEQLYPESIGKVSVIPHGIHETNFSSQKEYKTKLELEHHTVLSTFGLLSPGKGIEYVINALPEVIKKNPSILYLILGETHPVVRRRQGEQYRNKLSRLVTKLKLEDHVKFYDQYLSLTDLFEFLKATDIYISTSTDPNQAVSGTLSYALGTGRAVISTEFAQSKEIVTPEIGRLIPIKDSSALTKALLDLLRDKKRLQKMSRTAYDKTRPMLWSNVAKQYISHLTNTVVPPLKLDHLKRMTDDFGLFQFASFSKPNKSFGYTLDDNARSLILCSGLIKQTYTKELERLIIIYLNFIQACQKDDGSFINYIDNKHKKATSQNTEEDLEDAHARAVLALCEVIGNNKLPSKIREKARKIFLLAFKKAASLTHLRSKAIVIKAFSFLLKNETLDQNQLREIIKMYTDSLQDSLEKNSHGSWLWFEDGLHYNNGILPESLLIAGDVTNNSAYTDRGIDTLNFLIEKTFSSEYYQPIGHSEWYKHTKKRSYYDQQPEDPASMISVLAYAYKSTNQEEYKNLARKCFSWFLGNNSMEKSLYDEKTGGCYDGLHPDRVNLNQGAESLVSYLISNFVIQELNK